MMTFPTVSGKMTVMFQTTNQQISLVTEALTPYHVNQRSPVWGSSSRRNWDENLLQWLVNVLVFHITQILGRFHLQQIVGFQ